MKKIHNLIYPAWDGGHTERGLGFLGFVLVLPAVFVTGLVAWGVLEFIGNISAFERAALEAANISTNVELSGDSWVGGSKQQLIKYTENLPLCKSTQNNNTDCLPQSDLTRYSWKPGSAGSPGIWSSGIDNLPLPFELYQPNPILPAYNSTQFLPRVCIPVFCASRDFGTITTPKPLGNTRSCSQYCYYLPTDPDTDGDGKGDLLFFNPKAGNDYMVLSSGAGYTPSSFDDLSPAQPGTGGTANIRPPLPIPADYDGDGITDLASLIMQMGEYTIKLSSLPGVLARGILPPYLSVESSGASSSTISAIFAVPGNFINSTPKLHSQILTFSSSATTIANPGGGDSKGGVRPSENFNLIEPLVIADQSTGEPQYIDLTGVGPAGSSPGSKAEFNLSTLNAGKFTNINQTATNQLRTAPKDGQFSLPIAIDINLDGVDEFGWISWFGGGAVQRALGLETPNLITSNNRIEPHDSLELTSGAHNQFKVKFYPFHIASSYQNQDEGLYTVDPIARRIFRAERTGDPLDVTQVVTNVINWRSSIFDNIRLLTGDYGTAIDTLANVAGEEAHDQFKLLFPTQNIWNTPTISQLLTTFPTLSSVITMARTQEKPSGPKLGSPSGGALTPGAVTNGSLRLIEPRQIKVAPDGKGYVTDQAGRIVQLNRGDAESTHPEVNGIAKTIIGNIQAHGRSCSDPSLSLTSGDIVQDNPVSGGFLCSEFGRYNFSPLALEIIPRESVASDAYGVSRYDLVVSDGRTLKLIRNLAIDGLDSVACRSADNCGPNGDVGESVFTIAGSSTAATKFNPDGLKVLLDHPPSGGSTGIKAIDLELCPIVSIAYDHKYSNSTTHGNTPRAAIIAALNCSAQWGGTDFDASGNRKYYYIDRDKNILDAAVSPQREHYKAGMIVRIIAKNNAGTYTPQFEPGAPNEIELVAGGLYSQVDENLATFSHVYKDEAGVDWYKPQVDLGIPDGIDHWKLREVYVLPSAVEVDPVGNILFIQQNASAPHSIGKGNLASSYDSTLYRINQYRYYRRQDNDRIEAITSPLMDSDFIPHETSHLFAPYRDDPADTGSNSPYVKDRVTPPGLTKAAAVGAIALGHKYKDVSEIFTSSVFVNPDVVNDSGYITIGAKDPGIGTFYKFLQSPMADSRVTRIIEDTDGDGYSDLVPYKSGNSWNGLGKYGNDDIDGDGVKNGDEMSSDDRSPTCPEVYGNPICRWTEIVKAPTVYLFRLKRNDSDPEYFKVPTRSGMTLVNFVEFALVNFVSDFFPGLGSRPEDMNLTFNAGNGPRNIENILLTAETKGPRDLENLLPKSEAHQGDGPTVLFGPLHIVAGGPDPSTTGLGLPGKSLPDARGGRNFQFPNILNSKFPDQLGFKFVRRVAKAKYDRDDGGKPVPSITRSGVLCYDYERPGLDTQNRPFGFNQDGHNFLHHFAHPAILESGGSPSSDVFDYVVDCTASPQPLGLKDPLGPEDGAPVFDKALTEALVLQVDHNQKQFENGSSSSGGISSLNSKTGGGGPTSWPRNAFTGALPGQPENIREVLALKLERREDPSKNLAFINRDVMFDSIDTMFSSAAPISGESPHGRKPVRLAVTDLERDTSVHDYNSLAAQDAARYPISDLTKSKELSFDDNPDDTVPLNKADMTCSYIRLGQYDPTTSGLYGSLFDGGRDETLGFPRKKGGGLCISLDTIFVPGMYENYKRILAYKEERADLAGAKLPYIESLGSGDLETNPIIKTFLNSLIGTVKLDTVQIIPPGGQLDQCEYDPNRPNKVCIHIPAGQCTVGAKCSAELSYHFPFLGTHFRTDRTIELGAVGTQYNQPPPTAP